MSSIEDRLGEIDGRAKWANVSMEPHAEPYPAALSVADIPHLTAALRAVLALHQPVEEVDIYVCLGCDADNYPCPTVTAITAALTPAEAKL